MFGIETSRTTDAAFSALALVVSVALLVDWFTLQLAPSYSIYVVAILVILESELDSIRSKGLRVRLNERQFFVPDLRGWLVIGLSIPAVYALSFVAEFVTSQLLRLPDPSQHTGVAAANTESTLVVATYVVVFFLFVGPVEEYLFRYYLQRKILGERLGVTSRVVLASLLFGLVHVGVYGFGVSALVAASYIAVYSLVFGFAYEYTDNLTVPAVAHAVINTIVLLTAYVGV